MKFVEIILTRYHSHLCRIRTYGTYSISESLWLRPCIQLTYIIKGYERGKKHLSVLATSQYRIEFTTRFTTTTFNHFWYCSAVCFTLTTQFESKMKFSVLLIVLVLLYCTDDVRGRRGRGRGRTKSRVNCLKFREIT